MNHILLLHGALGSIKQFEALSVLLSDKYQVHSLNFSGHGGLEIPDEVFSTELFCNDVLDYLNRLNLESVYIFGYSMGGYVAINFAIQNPAKVKAVFTLATVFDWSPQRATEEAMRLNPEKIAEKVPAFAKELEHRHSPSDWKLVLTKTAEMMISLGESHLTESDFSKLNIPVRISVGDSDKMVSIESSSKVCNALPNASLLILPDTPHPFERVNLNRLTKEISEFFK